METPSDLTVDVDVGVAQRASPNPAPSTNTAVLSQIRKSEPPLHNKMEMEGRREVEK